MSLSQRQHHIGFCVVCSTLEDTLERRTAALQEIAEGEETSYLACPGLPHCGRNPHYPNCPVAIARTALAEEVPA